jgi:transposase
MSAQRKKYTKDFKKDTVMYLLNSGKEIKEVAKDMGINASQLSKWKREFLNDSENAFPGNGNPKDKELFELKKKLADITEERDILKKALAIFS